MKLIKIRSAAVFRHTSFYHFWSAARI